MNYDVCIIGGGTSGAFAAISAAKEGLNVLLVEKYSCLGGTSVNSLVTPSMPTYVNKSPLYLEFEECLKKYEGEIYSPEYEYEMTKDSIKRPNENSTVMHFSAESMMYALEELCEHYNVNILYDGVFVNSIIENGKIISVMVQTVSGPINIKATNFVDATGDGLLSELSGVEMQVGNEEDGDNQFTSLRFEISNVDIEKFLNLMNNELEQTYATSDYPFYTYAVSSKGRDKGTNQVLEPFMRKALDDGVISKEEYVWLQAFSIPSKPNTFSYNSPRIPNKTNISDPFVRSANYAKGRKMILKFVDFHKKYIPGFENAFLGKVAVMLGVRESKRIVGEYILTKDDYIQRNKFEDGITDCDWYIDIHRKVHIKNEEQPFQNKEYFEIPYRSLISRKVDNLIVCGRCISADFAAQASIRVQPSCRMMGESVGKALRISKETGINLNKIDGRIIKKELAWKLKE